MSATRRLPQISLLLAAASISIAAVSKQSFRERVVKALGISVPGGLWRLLAIFLAVINLKNLPFVWHYRLFHSLLYHLFLQPTPIQPTDLFKPIIQTTHTPWSEADYNLHKSNATYFTDLDIARTHLVTALLRKGIRGVGTRPDEENATFSFRNTSRAAGHKRRGSLNALAGSGEGGVGVGTVGMTEAEWWKAATQPGALLVALGGVTCHFHKEIAPYRRYEIWTRLMTWDRKWLYIVSHFVEAGAFKPTSYSLQPKRKGTLRVEELTAEERGKLRRKVFASSVAKYVVKKGRLTIPPELVLERSQMLPPRPAGTPVLGGWTPGSATGGGSRGVWSAGASVDVTPERTATPSPNLSPASEGTTVAESSGVLEESLFPLSSGNGEEWTWAKVQEQREKGLKLAEAFDGLDGLKDVFDLRGEEALGRYTDLMFDF